MSFLIHKKPRTISGIVFNRSSCSCLQGFQIVPSEADMSRRELIGLDRANAFASDHATSKYMLPIRI